MIRPMDIQVNLNAIPEYARMNVVEQSGELSRHMRDMGKARLENLNRSQDIPDLEPSAEANMNRLESLIDRPRPPSVQRKSARRNGEGARTGHLDEIYAPRKLGGGRHRANLDENAGEYLDFSA